MPFTKTPVRKIAKIAKFLQSDFANLTIDQAVDMLKRKFNVGVFVNQGRLLQHYHELEIYSCRRGEWQALICRVEVPVTKFKLD